jgi:hypothetical protein
MANLVDIKAGADGQREAWSSVDGGQGQANVNEAILRCEYLYDPATATVTNQHGQRERRVYGWVDLEVLANAS